MKIQNTKSKQQTSCISKLTRMDSMFCVAIFSCSILSVSHTIQPALSKPPAITSNKKTATTNQKKRTNKELPAYSAAMIEKGRKLFLSNGCLDCHNLGSKGNTEGVSLDGIGQKRSASFLQKQLQDPESHVANSPKEFGGDPNLMTAPDLTASEINAVVAYLKSLVVPTRAPK